MWKIATAALAATASLGLSLASAQAATHHHPVRAVHHLHRFASPPPVYEAAPMMRAPALAEPEYFEQAAPDIAGGP